MTRADQLDATRERHARWFALVMDAAAAHLHAQARLLHTLDPDHTATVAWVACEPRPAALEARR